MDIEQLSQVQRECAPAMMGALVNGARRRFLASARLLEWRSPDIQFLEEFGIQRPIELCPLLKAFDVLCARYRERFWSPQIGLFEKMGEAPDEVWSRYFYWTLLPHVLQDDSLVRNILRSVGGLPTNNHTSARDAVRQYFVDTSLPTGKPLWAPEDILTLS